MILICGIDVQVEQLPLYEVLNYEIETNEKRVEIKLKTVAKSTDCFGVFLPETYQAFPLSEEVKEKTTFFTDLDDLLLALTPAEETPAEETPTEEEEAVTYQTGAVAEVPVDTPETEPQAEDGKEKTIAAAEGFDDFPELLSPVIEEATTDLSDIFLTLPTLNQNFEKDKNQYKLDEQAILLQQKEIELHEKQQEINELYRIQEIQLHEMRDKYEERISLINDTLDQAQKQLKDGAASEESRWITKFAPYGKMFRGIVTEQFPLHTYREINPKLSPLYLFASTGGDSLSEMQRNIEGFMQEYPDSVIVDLTGERFLNQKFRINSKDSSLLLRDPDVPINNIVKRIGRTDFIPTTPFNDLVLLQIDWEQYLARLFEYAGTRKVVLLFNNFTNFSVRYALSYLANVGELYLFAKSAPYVLLTTMDYLQFVRDRAIRLVVTDFIEDTKPMLDTLGNQCEVIAFKDRVIWKKLKIK